jgi:predicted MFS family arabinose efflux permease
VRQLSLALGPVIGGLLAGSVGWRSIFWLLRIGLCFLANGCGCVLGSILAGKPLNYDYRREALRVTYLTFTSG